MVNYFSGEDLESDIQSLNLGCKYLSIKYLKRIYFLRKKSHRYVKLIKFDLLFTSIYCDTPAQRQRIREFIILVTSLIYNP